MQAVATLGPPPLHPAPHLFGQAFQPNPDGLGHTRGVAVTPTPFDEHAPGAPVACECQTAAPDGLAGGALGRHETEEGHELAGTVEPANVTDFADKRGGTHERDPTQRLISRHHWSP